MGEMKKFITVSFVMLIAVFGLIGCSNQEQTSAERVEVEEEEAAGEEEVVEMDAEVISVASDSAKRPTTMGLDGMVTTPHYLASQAALDVLQDGGNAVDAAVAAASTLAVVYHYSQEDSLLKHSLEC